MRNEVEQHTVVFFVVAGILSVPNGVRDEKSDGRNAVPVHDRNYRFPGVLAQRVQSLGIGGGRHSEIEKMGASRGFRRRSGLHRSRRQSSDTRCCQKLSTFHCWSPKLWFIQEAIIFYGGKKSISNRLGFSREVLKAGKNEENRRNTKEPIY